MLPGLVEHIVTSRLHDAAGLPGPAASVPRGRVRAGAESHPERLVPAAQQSEEVERLYLVGAGTHPGAGVPGVLSSARVLDRVVPDAA